jgi:hypothetical protein
MAKKAQHKVPAKSEAGAKLLQMMKETSQQARQTQLVGSVEIPKKPNRPTADPGGCGCSCC